MTSPVWALVALFGLLAMIPGAGNTPGEPIIALGAAAPFVGGIPIFRMEAGSIAKILIFASYYAVCAVAMFIAGWMSLLVFGIGK